jgi:hypothetical protein
VYQIGENLILFRRACVIGSVNKLQQNGKGDQKNDHPFKDFQPASGRLIGDFFIDAFESLQLANDAGVPFIEMESPVDQAVDARQILVAEKLERVVDPFEQQRIVHLKLGHTAQISAVVAEKSWQAPRPLGERFVGFK